VAEYWRSIPGHPGGGIRKDLFGFVDVVAIGEGAIIAIQATSGANGSARVHKIVNECHDAALEWLLAGGRIEVWAWKKYAKKGPDNKFWQVRRTPVIASNGTLRSKLVE
jgi:hypothetical protein